MVKVGARRENRELRPDAMVVKSRPITHARIVLTGSFIVIPDCCSNLFPRQLLKVAVNIRIKMCFVHSVLAFFEVFLVSLTCLAFLPLDTASSQMSRRIFFPQRYGHERAPHRQSPRAGRRPNLDPICAPSRKETASGLLPLLQHLEMLKVPFLCLFSRSGRLNQ